MYIYTCESNYEAMLTCIYDAWASGRGHENIRLCVEPTEQYTLFDEYIHVEGDVSKAEKVSRSVYYKISPRVHWELSFVLASFEEDALDTAYRMLILGFAYGAKVVDMLQYKDVVRFYEIKKLVSREVYSFREFLRFWEVKKGMYVAHFEPRSRVVMPIAAYFADRMPSEHWMIIDDTHREAVVHPKDKECYLRFLSDEEFQALSNTQQEDYYSLLWKQYFRTMGIAERENKACQKNHFPLWMRKHVTEFL